MMYYLGHDGGSGTGLHLILYGVACTRKSWWERMRRAVHSNIILCVIMNESR